MGERKQKRNLSNIFYGVIGVATLMVAVIGATFAYFTATAANNVISGNMATVDFDLSVAKVTNVDVTKGGMIPMSNNMVEQAVSGASNKGICLDDNGNAVCQVYKITVNNTGTVGMFVDGYVTLTGGSGVPEDLPTAYTYAAEDGTATSGYAATTMRWAQAFCTTEDSNNLVTKCSTGNKIDDVVHSTLRTDTGKTAVEIAKIGVSDAAKADGANKAEILFKHEDIIGSTTINTNTYEVIDTNYIRLSKHVDGVGYTKALTKSGNTYIYSKTFHDDTTSALVYNQYLTADDKVASNNTGTSSSTFTDSQVFYIVVWLSENGHNQTAGETNAATSAANFFRGNVTFVTSQGTEVTATFSGHVKVDPNTMQIS